MRARDFILETADQGSIDKIIGSFVSSPVGQKYAKHDCKTVTRAFVQWADQNQIPTQVINLAPPSAAFIEKNPRFQGKSGEGDGHIMPIVDGQAIDFTVRQFGVNRPFDRPLITPVADLPSVYGRFGYFTDRPEWFLGGKTHWIGPLNQIPAEIFNQEFGDEILEQGVREGSLNEYRDRMYQYIKSIVPGFPDYVVKDWLYANFARGATQGPGWSFDTIGKDIPKILADMGLSVNTKWQLIPNMEFTMNMWEPKTLKRLQARAGGSSKSTDPDVHIPARDAERHTTQAQLAQQQGGVRKEPVILIKTAKGYELLEGWHRTIQHFAKYPNGYTGPAYVAVAQGQQGVAEVKILSRVKGKGSEPGQLPRFGRPIAPGDETRYLGTKVADWQGREIWRDYLGGQLSYHLFDPDTRTVIVTTFGSRYKMNPRSYIIHGLYAAPGNPVRAAEFYRGLVRDLGLTLISDRKQSPGGNRVWQQLEQFPDVEVYGYDTNTDQALNFGAGDVEMYTVPSAAVAGSKEMQRVARDLRLVATARSQR